VTISYGAWPSEVFLLLFGFVPECPADAVCLFADLADWLAAAAPAALAALGGSEADAAAAEAGLRAHVLSALGCEDAELSRLVVTPVGFDARLMQLGAALDAWVRARGGGAVGMAVVRSRIADCRSAYGRALLQDCRLLEALQRGGALPAEQVKGRG